MTTKTNMRNERNTITNLIADLAGEAPREAIAEEVTATIAHLLARGGYRGEHRSDRRQELEAFAARVLADEMGDTDDDATTPADLFASALAEAVEVGDPTRARLAVAHLITAAAASSHIGAVGVGSAEHLGALCHLAEVDAGQIAGWFAEVVDVDPATDADYRVAAAIAAGSAVAS